jgi:FKBP-type peptidyl-prolyl cis-trans isomerase
MRKAVILAIAVLFLGSCKEKGAAAPHAGALDGDASYAFGMAFAAEFRDTGITFDYDNLIAGFKAYLQGEETRLTEEEAMEKVQSAYTAVLRRPEITFLLENAKRAGVITTASGLQYEVITEGSGDKPLASDTVQVNYEGTLIDGSVFDSSYERGEPVEFPLNSVISGWTEGLQLMNVGASYRFYLPSDLAYGESGAGSSIPPYSALIFKVDLLSIVEE